MHSSSDKPLIWHQLVAMTTDVNKTNHETQKLALTLSAMSFL